MKHDRPNDRGFSLVELLVVIAIIAVLGALTVISVRAVASSSRLASGRNTVSATLANARALAMKNNNIVAVVFRPRFDTNDQRTPQTTEIVVAEWTGESQLYNDFDGDGAVDDIVDRYVPIPNFPIRELPPGIKIAAPWYDNNSQDDIWITQSDFRAMITDNEVAGRLFAIQYAPNGAVVTRNPQSDSTELYLDSHDLTGEGPPDGIQLVDNSDPILPDVGNEWFNDHPKDENSLNPVPFLCIYDDDAARERKEGDWSNFNEYRDELLGPNGYINLFGRRIHFNRYTGVMMSTEDQR